MIYLLVLILMLAIDLKFRTSVMVVLVSPFICMIIYGETIEMVDNNSIVDTVEVREYTNGSFSKGKGMNSDSKFICITDNGLEEIPKGRATFKNGSKNTITEQRLKRKTRDKIFYLAFDKTRYIVEVEK